MAYPINKSVKTKKTNPFYAECIFDLGYSIFFTHQLKNLYKMQDIFSSQPYLIFAHINQHDIC